MSFTDFRSTMKFYEDTGDQFVLVSDPIYDILDWPFCFVIRVRHFERENDRDPDYPRHLLDFSVVSPEACIKHWDSCKRCFGFCDEDWFHMDFKSFCIALAEYGLCATVYSNCADRMRELMQDIRNRYWGLTFMLGATLDKPLNRIGADGWDFLKGNGHRPGEDDEEEDE